MSRKPGHRRAVLRLLPAGVLLLGGLRAGTAADPPAVPVRTSRCGSGAVSANRDFDRENFLSASQERGSKEKKDASQGKPPKDEPLPSGRGKAPGRNPNKDGGPESEGVPPARSPQDPARILDPLMNRGFFKRLEVLPRILAIDEDEFATRFQPLLTGDRNRLFLMIRELVARLGDLRYGVREKAERSLKNLGPRALPILEELGDPKDLEARIRLGYVRKALRAMGNEDLIRRALRARTLAEALEYRIGPLEARALMAALDHVDRRVQLTAIRSLGSQLARPDLAKLYGEDFRKAVEPEIESQDLELRNAALAALGNIPLASSRALLLALVRDGKRPLSLRILALRLLLGRKDQAPVELRADLVGIRPPLLKALAETLAAPPLPSNGKDSRPPAAVRVFLQDDPGLALDTSIRGLRGDRIAVLPAEGFGNISELRIPRALIEKIEVVHDSEAPPPRGIHLLMKTGSRLRITDPKLEGKTLVVKALGRELRIPLKKVRGLMGNPTLRRFFGGSRKFDQCRLSKDPKTPIGGKLLGFTGDGIRFETSEGERPFSWKEVRSLLLRLETKGGPLTEPGDLNQFVLAELRDGQRLVGYLGDLGPTRILLADEIFGIVEIPLADIESLHLSNSGSALSGFTLIVDYGNIKVYEVDNEGKEVWALPLDLFGPVDAELLPNGNLLITEQEDNAVREYDRDGEEVWSFGDLDTPRDADILRSGNILITDTKNNRVIEVDRKKRILWTFGRKEARDSRFKPYDADRLPNGNTLIADFGGSRILEVAPDGSIVWEQKNLPFCYDADRLPNGDTLVTLHKTGKGPSTGKILEFNPNHQIVWQLTRLKNPSDADRLPDGTTMVCEVSGVSIYGRQGKLLSRFETDWATEASRY